jgi:hypothetical protein
MPVLSCSVFNNEEFDEKFIRAVSEPEVVDSVAEA